MLIALLTIFLLGGGSFGPMEFFDQAKDTSKTAIADDDQRKEVQATLKTMTSRAKGYSKDANKVMKDMRKGFSDHEALAEHFDGFFTVMAALNTAYSNDIIEMRFDLRDQVTREQWADLFPVEK